MGELSFSFVMDGRRLHAPSVLLAGSLQGQMGDEVEVIAYVPEARGTEMPRVLEIMPDQLKVYVCSMKTDHVTWVQPYPHGNEIIAARQPRDCQLSDVPDDVSLFAVPEDVPTWKVQGEAWVPVYDMFDLPSPSQRVHLVRGRAVEILPSFISSFVGFREAHDAAGSPLPDLWRDSALRLDHGQQIEGKSPWLEQIALPDAAVRAVGRIRVLPESYNYSLYRRGPEEQSFDPRRAHYHMPAHYRQWDSCRAVTEHALAICPPKKRQHLDRHPGVFQRGLRE